MKHSIFGGSSAYRWLRCQASLLRGVCPELANTGNVQSRIGTALHAVMDQLLKFDSPAGYSSRTSLRMAHEYSVDELIDAALLLHAPEVTRKPEHSEWVINALNNTKRIITSLFGYEEIVCYYERTVYHDDDRAFGTPDLVVVSRDTMLILDFKFGQQLVEAKDNFQLAFYAVAATLEIGGGHEVWGAIVQPPRGYSAHHMMSLSLLQLMEGHIKEAIANYDSGACRPYAGPWCDYCPRRQVCPEINGAVRRLMEELRLDKDVSGIARDALLADLKIQADKETVSAILQRGGSVPGFALVKEAQRSAWNPEFMDEIVWAMQVAIEEHDLEIRDVLPTPAAVKKAAPELFADMDGWHKWVMQVPTQPKVFRETANTSGGNVDEATRLFAHF